MKKSTYQSICFSDTHSIYQNTYMNNCLSFSSVDVLAWCPIFGMNHNEIVLNFIINVRLLDLVCVKVDLTKEISVCIRKQYKVVTKKNIPNSCKSTFGEAV